MDESDKRLLVDLQPRHGIFENGDFFLAEEDVVVIGIHRILGETLNLSAVCFLGCFCYAWDESVLYFHDEM